MAIKDEVQKLCDRGEKVIDSESLFGLNYVVKDGSIFFLTEKNGQFAILLDLIPTLCKELTEIYEVFGDLKTTKCYRNRGKNVD